jgi:hypothetical protein
MVKMDQGAVSPGREADFPATGSSRLTETSPGAIE